MACARLVAWGRCADISTAARGDQAAFNIVDNGGGVTDIGRGDVENCVSLEVLRFDDGDFNLLDGRCYKKCEGDAIGATLANIFARLQPQDLPVNETQS